MGIFLNDSERAAIKASLKDKVSVNVYWGLLNRARRRAEAPGQTQIGGDTEWWHNAAELLTDGALACALAPSPEQKAWLKGVTLDIARRPVSDWIGPFFRNHSSQPPQGHLETAHLSIAVSVVYDLHPDLFTPSEAAEIVAALKEKGIALCLNWLDASRHLMNWRCILLSGVAVAAAVLDEKETLKRVRSEYELCLNVVQPDGSYAESLQYSNYCYYGLMMTCESLLRRQPELEAELSVAPYAKAVSWFASSLLYRKPVDGWGSYPLPRSVNFNDSAAIFGPMPDLLMHIAARAPKELSKEATLASWLFDHLYGENPAQGPFDRSTFGFVNRCGFLSVLLRPKAPAPMSPEDAGLALTSRFSNGNCILRSSWNEAGTVLAFNGASDPLSAPGHLHRDLGSFILVHGKERLLADPGHSCYRNLIHDVECSTKAHNCCTFKAHGSGELLEQRGCAQRKIGSDGKLLDLVKRPGEHLLCASLDDVSVAATELAEAYGKPLVSCKRFCILAGEHVVFVVDSIESSEPVEAKWNWLLNNRDGQLDFKLVHPDRLVARRGNAGMKLFHIGEASLSGPLYGYVHDAYHPLPNQLGEGKPGSGLHFAWSGKESMRQMAGHAIVVDSYGLSAGWHMRAKSPSQFALESPGGSCFWELSMDYEAMTLREAVSGRSYSIAKGQNGNWSLSR